MNKDKKISRRETCPKCNRDALLKPVGHYGTRNMKYRCSRCGRWTLDEETRNKLQEGAHIYV